MTKHTPSCHCYDSADTNNISYTYDSVAVKVVSVVNYFVLYLGITCVLHEKYAETQRAVNVFQQHRGYEVLNKQSHGRRVQVK